MFPQDYIEKVKERANCKEIYESWGGVVHKNVATCIRPHSHKNGDKNPSMVISPQGFKCMVPTCGIKGDCFELVKTKMGIDFNQAIVYISTLYNIPIPITQERKKVVNGPIVPAKDRVQEKPKIERKERVVSSSKDIHQITENYLPEGITSIKEEANFAKFCETAHVNLLDSVEAQAYLNSRGIGMDTAKKCFLGYDKDSIVVPYTINYKVVYWSSRNIKQKIFNQPAVHIPCPIGFDNLHDNRIIYIAEGLFDYLTLIEKGYAALGVPGANNWKHSREWNSLLLGNKVMLCFHGDEEGWKTNKMIAEICQGLSVPFEIADWGVTREYRDVKDLNDWVMKGREIGELFHSEKHYYISDVKNTMAELIDLSNYPSALDLTIATILANLMEGDPVWILLVGPPSVGKTEMIRSVNNAVSTYFINRISPNTLTSGYTKSEYADIITRIVKPTTFCITDFGSFLSFHPQDMQKIMQQLRDIYDGKVHTEYGNGKIIDWSGKVGIIGGITPEIERHSGFIGRLGDRFLYYRMAIPEEKRSEIARRALRDNINEDKLRHKIQQVTTHFLDNLVLHISDANKVTIPEYIIGKIAAACDLFSRARTPIARMHDFEKTIEYKPEYEFVGRVARAFKVLVKAIAHVRGKVIVDMADYQVILDICHGSIPSLRLDFLKKAYRLYCSDPSLWMGTPKFAEEIGKDTATARFHLRNLLALGLMDIDTDLKKEHKWRIRMSIVSLIEYSDFFEKPNYGEEK